MARAKLQSRSVLVTRPAGQAAGFCRLITDAGGEAVRFPVIEIQPLSLHDQQAEQLKNWRQFDLAVFISANAVQYALAYINNRGAAPSIAAVGAKTAQALIEAGYKVDLVPKAGFNSEALLALPELQALNGKRVLLLKGEGGRDLLTQTLSQRGAEVVELALYQRGLPKARTEELNQRGRQGSIHLVAVTSVDILSNLQKLLGVEGQGWLKQTPLLAGSTRIAKQARSEGFRQIIVASDPSDESMFSAVLQWNEEQKAEFDE